MVQMMPVFLTALGRLKTSSSATCSTCVEALWASYWGHWISDSLWLDSVENILPRWLCHWSSTRRFDANGLLLASGLLGLSGRSSLPDISKRDWRDLLHTQYAPKGELEKQHTHAILERMRSSNVVHFDLSAIIRGLSLGYRGLSFITGCLCQFTAKCLA